jgi:3-methyl-2-oxobutanoate hydroxymethyltransferase
MKKITVNKLQDLKDKQEPITILTAYDATFSKLLSEQGIDAILVGDSLGTVLQGHSTTVPVSIDDMCYHTQCVARGNQGAFLIADLPYMTYATPSQTYDNAAQLMQAGANMVKLEGGQWLTQTVAGLTERGIPVCTHLGLTPQSVDALSGYKIQGRDQDNAKQMLEDALALEKAGAKLLVLECVPQDLAKTISKKLTIPTIGIGAGKDTDGQVLVLHDMLGLNKDFQPKFVHNFMQDDNVTNVADAIQNYIRAVKNRSFPTAEHSFD